MRFGYNGGVFTLFVAANGFQHFSHYWIDSAITRGKILILEGLSLSVVPSATGERWGRRHPAEFSQLGKIFGDCFKSFRANSVFHQSCAVLPHKTMGRLEMLCRTSAVCHFAVFSKHLLTEKVLNTKARQLLLQTPSTVEEQRKRTSQYILRCREN